MQSAHTFEATHFQWVEWAVRPGDVRLRAGSGGGGKWGRWEVGEKKNQEE